MNLDAYFARIGYGGSAAPTFETLAAVQAGHAASIAFENLNPLLGWPVPLDVESLEQKMVSEGRGGWCFEQNRLFSAALEQIGFHVRGLGARVLWNAPEGMLGARSHMALLVRIDGREYIADVGFGGQSLTSPLILEPATVQETPLDAFRFTREGNDFILQTRIAGVWKPMYRFGLEAQYPPDYEVSNWFLCTHASSFFRRDLVCARATSEARYALRNTDLSIYRPGEESEKRKLTSAGELKSAVTHEFLIRLPESPELDAALARIVTPLQ